jgi:hypothetical protein
MLVTDESQRGNATHQGPPATQPHASPRESHRWSSRLGQSEIEVGAALGGIILGVGGLLGRVWALDVIALLLACIAFGVLLARVVPASTEDAQGSTRPPTQDEPPWP